MKIFSYDPSTGRRGEQIDTAGVFEWTDQSVDYQVSNNVIKPIDCKVPEIRGQNWTVHVDAGRGDESYQRDEWICACMGEMICGEGQGEWEWVILPPKSAIRSTT